MNARQRRRERRIDARISAGIDRDLAAYWACKDAMVEADRAVMGPALGQMFRVRLPPELQQYAPTVEWR